MRNQWKILLVIFFLLYTVSNVRSQTENNDVLLVNGAYHIEIIASQWQYEAIDLYRVDNLVENGMKIEEARAAASYTSTIGRFIIGKTINLSMRSTDVQHGFKLTLDEEYGGETLVEVPLNRPSPEEEFGPFTNTSIVLPDQPMNIGAGCYIFCGLDHIKMKLDFQIVEPESAEVLDLQNTQIISAITGVTIGLAFLGFKLHSINTRKGLNIPLRQRKIISEIFQSRTSVYYYVMGHKTIKNADVEEKIQDAIPNDIYEFKFLLHPVRLSMTKVLYENLKMTTIEIKEVLGVSSNDINTHLNALQKKGYVHTEHQFLDGSRKQIVSLEPYGIDQYKILIDLLHLFLDNIDEYQINFDDEK